MDNKDNLPKNVHYCWFGRGEKPEIVKKCIRIWKKYLSDYQIIEWNEDNFPVNSNLYVKGNYKKSCRFMSEYRSLIRTSYGI